LKAYKFREKRHHRGADSKGAVRTLRTGINGFTCMPDNEEYLILGISNERRENEHSLSPAPVRIADRWCLSTQCGVAARRIAPRRRV
jgi:hypothetical protein